MILWKEREFQVKEPRVPFLLLALYAGIGGIPFTAELAPYTRPTVLEPFPDGVRLAVPPDLGNRQLAELGLVDVTVAPFRADPTGTRDSTAALQQAIVRARDAQMVCFFPPGVYRVSDTLSCIQDLYRRSNGMVVGGRMHPCVLVGSRRGPRRPRILLAPRSPGFSDPKKPKYVVHFWARSMEGKPTEPQPNISMNQMLVGIDIAIGEGNPGAVAIRHRAAQGSGVQDCTIDATHGLAGLEGGAGSGGGHAGIIVLGGRIGLDLRETQPAPTVSGVELIGQTDAAILCGSRQALCLVGFRIATRAKGPIIRSSAPRWAPHNGQMCLVDGVVEGQTPGFDLLRTERSVTLHNVYAQGAARIDASPGFPGLPGSPDGWMHVAEYARGIDPPVWRKLSYQAPVYENGTRRGDTVMAIVPGQAPPDDLRQRHLWGSDFPHLEMKGIANVKAPPYNARGDGQADDTAAIQRAIDASDAVLLPKGTYRLTRTLTLRARTRLIGVSQHLSMLFVREPEGDFADPATPRPLVRTVDDADAETVLAFCGVFAPYHVDGAFAVEWRAGRRSIVRSVMFRRGPLYGYRRAPAGAEPKQATVPAVAIRGAGGGRWYTVFGENHRNAAKSFRHLLVEGTAEPLAFYQCNPEHVRGDANMEIARASHVAIYGLKSEGNDPVLWVHDSDHIRVFGYGGNAAAREGTALFRIENTPNFLIANAVDSPRLAGQGSDAHFAGRGVDPHLWHMIREHPPAGPPVLTAPLERPVLYRRGRPRAQWTGDTP